MELRPIGSTFKESFFSRVRGCFVDNVWKIIGHSHNLADYPGGPKKSGEQLEIVESKEDFNMNFIPQNGTWVPIRSWQKACEHCKGSGIEPDSMPPPPQEK